MFDRRLLANFDWTLLGLMLLIQLIGVGAIYSASQGYDTDVQYWVRQLYWIGIGLVVGFLVLLLDFQTIGNWSYLIHTLVLGSLVLVIFYGSGGPNSAVNRWFIIFGVAVQPSEFAKYSTVLAVAFYFRDSARTGNLDWRQLIFPSLLVFLPFFLIVQQPDLGTALLLVMVFIPVFLLAGVRWKIVGWLVLAGGVGIALLVASFSYGTYPITPKVTEALEQKRAPAELVERVKSLEGDRFYFWGNLLEVALPGQETPIEGDPTWRWIETLRENSFSPFISAVLRPYQQRRLVTFINPESDPLGDGYQIIQSKVAIGSGRLVGKGYGNSTQGTLNFLPARHTDFLFSHFSEEWGFLGSIALLALYAAFLLRAINTVYSTQDRFSAFLALGVVSIITFQFFINVGMTLGLLPVVGVPMPFVSYGGSSMITTMGGVALILNVRMRRFLWN